MSATRLLAAALVLTAATGGPVRPADAQGDPAPDLVVDGGGLAPDGPILVVDDLQPGDEVEATFAVSNEGASGGALVLELRRSPGGEHGCEEPEVEAGDRTCGPGDDGELADALRLELAGPGGTVLAGRLSSLAAAIGPVVLADEVGAGESLPYTLRVAVDRAAGNEIMGDDLQLELLLTLEGSLQPGQVPTTTTAPPGGVPTTGTPDPRRGPLPRTGADLVALTAAAVALVAAGAGLRRLRSAGGQPS